MGWRRFVGVLKSLIVWNLRIPLSQLELFFEKERVKIRSQSYRTFDISFLLQLWILGKGFSKMKAHEIISNKKKKIWLILNCWVGWKIYLTYVGSVGFVFKKMGETSRAAGNWKWWQIMEYIVLGMFWRMWVIDTGSYNLPLITFSLLNIHGLAGTKGYTSTTIIMSVLVVWFNITGRYGFWFIKVATGS